MDSTLEERLELSESSKVLRFKCTLCGRCCKDPQTFVNLTYLDILRIKKGLNLSEKELLGYIGFYTFNKENIKVYIEHMVYSPVMTERGLAFIGVLRDEQSRCIFLDSDNLCTIYSFRPRICTSFPFTLKQKEKKEDLENKTGVSKSVNRSVIDIGYTTKGIEYCPGISKKAPIVKKPKISSIISESLAEIESDYRMIESWNKLVEEDKIKPGAAIYIHSIIKTDEKVKETKSQKHSHLMKKSTKVSRTSARKRRKK